MGKPQPAFLLFSVIVNRFFKQIVEIHFNSKTGARGQVQVSISNVQWVIYEYIISIEFGSGGFQFIEVGHGHHDMSA